MKTLTHKSVLHFCVMLLFPLLFSCSAITGNGRMSDNPTVAAQQREVQQLEREVLEAERLAEEAKQREKAAKNRLKAAEHELKALQEQAKRRSEY